MENIFDYRMVIITDDNPKNILLKSNEKDSLIVEGEYYQDDNVKILKYTSNKMHHDCLEDYAQKKEYDFPNMEYITAKNNIIIYVLTNATLAISLPAELTPNQLYKLEYVENWCKDSEKIVVRKYDTNGLLTEEYEFESEEKTPQESFSHEVIQSYYNKKRKGR